MPRGNKLTRRGFVQTGVARTVASTSLGIGRLAKAQATKPNIIFILADDLGFADVSCYGQRDDTTPDIDRIASEGLRFKQAYSNSAVCSPTRAAMVTGRYRYRLPVGLEEPIAPTTPRSIRLPPSHPTLPSILKKADHIGRAHPKM